MAKVKAKTNMEMANELRLEFIKDLNRSNVLSENFVRQIDNYMFAIQQRAFGAGVDARITLKKGESYQS